MSETSGLQTMAKSATIYRMVMPSHTCPFGIKGVDLLKRRGFKVEDHHLTTRQEPTLSRPSTGSPPRLRSSLADSGSVVTTISSASSVGK